MNLYQQIQANRTKWYALISIIALGIFLFTGSAFWRNFSLGVLMGSVIYFTVTIFQRMRKGKQG